MALKRRNAEASKDAAVRCIYFSVYPLRKPTNTISGRVRQHPPQACCRGQVPAAGDEEAPRFFHAQVNLPSRRNLGWVTLRSWLAETQVMQVVSLGQESSPCKNGFVGVGIWSSLECPMISTGRASQKRMGVSFFEQCSSHSKKVSQETFSKIFMFSKLSLGLCCL